MRAAYKIANFLNYLGFGVIVPIQSLMFYEHGCKLEAFGLILGIYAATILIAEIPSGIFADIYGRKNLSDVMHFKYRRLPGCDIIWLYAFDRKAPPDRKPTALERLPVHGRNAAAADYTLLILLITFIKRKFLTES